MRLVAKTVKITSERRRLLRRRSTDRRDAVRWEPSKAMRRARERRDDHINPWDHIRKR